MASGINKSKERDAAIANLIRMACGDEFKKQVCAALDWAWNKDAYKHEVFTLGVICTE